MTVTYVGGLSLAVAVPAAASAVASGTAGINGALPDITARLEALAAFAPVPVNFAAQLSLAQATVASVQSAIALGLTPPSIDAQIAMVVALVAELEATVAAVNANLTALTDLQAILDVDGVHVYAYDGTVEDLGPELTLELAAGLPAGSPTDAARAIVLITSDPSAWTAMQAVFRVTP